MQTSYSIYQSAGLAGALYDMKETDVMTYVAAATVPFGVMVSKGTGDSVCKLPTTAAEVLASLGLALRVEKEQATVGGNDASYAAKDPISVMKKGRAWVAVEEAVNDGDDVYIRYANGIADSALVQKGAFRKSYDGTAQVTTLTPTAANGKSYEIQIRDADGDVVATASYTSDSDGTATEICDGLRAALGTVSGYAFTGTATLIITASVPGVAFTVTSSGDGAFSSITTGTANAKSAEKLPNAKYITTQATVGGLAVVELNLI